MKNAEKEFRKLSKNKNKLNKVLVLSKRTKFDKERRAFDKMLKKRKRAYCRGVLLEVEEMNVTNPTAFWEKIRKLGPKKKASGIPWEVEQDGLIISDKKLVLEHWKSDFEKLYCINGEDFDDDFKKARLKDLESEILINTETDGPVNKLDP